MSFLFQAEREDEVKRDRETKPGDTHGERG